MTKLTDPLDKDSFGVGGERPSLLAQLVQDAAETPDIRTTVIASAKLLIEDFW